MSQYAQALPVDGAGISLFFAADRRLPLGASDPASAEAERLQFTVGEGPRLTAHATGDSVLADAATLRSRWPAYFDALVARTADPRHHLTPAPRLTARNRWLDLYVTPPRDVGSLSLRDAMTVSAQVAAFFADSSPRRSRLVVPAVTWTNQGRRAPGWAVGLAPERQANP